MVSIATKITTDSFIATECNQLADELEQVVTDSGQTPNAGILDQVSKGIATIASNVDYYTDGGAADAYILSVIAPNKAPQSYRNGMRIRFRAVNPNTGASTVNVATLGVKNIKKQDGSTDPDATDISDARENTAVYDGTVFRLTTELNDATTTVKGIVELATDAETATATDTTRPVVPSALLSLFTASSQATSGYARIPINIGGAFDEVILQWGEVTLAGTAGSLGVVVTFPIAFSTAVFGAFPSMEETAFAFNYVGYSNLATTGVDFEFADTNSASRTISTAVKWFAIGY